MAAMRWPLVLVEWDDAVASVGWEDSSQKPVDMRPERVLSVGWQMERNNEHVLLTADTGPGADRSSNRRITIPMGMVNRILSSSGRVLYSKKRRRA